MKKFLDENFLLESKSAEALYHTYAKHHPIIDYHCHLSPKDLADNRSFNNISEAWLEDDHYKWRAMRSLGVEEHFVTGDARPREKFSKWAKTVPYTLRNPLYHWTHLELQRYFSITDLLHEGTSKGIYDKTREILSDDHHGCMDLVKQMKVEVICTTDDPVDDLEHHQRLLEQGSEVGVFPAFRPDKAFTISNPTLYKKYVQKLSKVSNTSILSYADLLDALAKRIEYFHENGCRVSDHGIESCYLVRDELNPEVIFEKTLSGVAPTEEEARSFQQSILVELGKMYHSKGWIQQFHLGALRNTNSRMLNALGPDTGFDSIGDYSQARGLAAFLDQLDKSNRLTKTILYNLNPSDNEIIATMVGNFNDGSVAGKVQFGTGWWYLDQKDGMERQMNALSNMGLISQFVGMLTDSRSFLSYPRHEYFRRILCNLFGKDIENGELPNDLELVGNMIGNICYHNAKNYFEFDAIRVNQPVS